MLRNNPAPTSSTTASAISETTSTLRICWRALPAVPERPPSLSESEQLRRVTCQAGASEKSIAETTVISKAKLSTCASRETLSPSMARSGASKSSARTPTLARATPNTAPATAIITLSPAV